MSDFRQDAVSGRWVIIAEQRAERPIEFQQVPVRRASSCPFCAGHERETPPAIASYQLPEARDAAWQVRVVPNRYPAIRAGQAQALCSSRLYESVAAVGAHEVIIESPQHHVSISQISQRHAALVCTAYRDRLQSLSQRAEVAYGLVFKNSGATAGASLEHLHSQLMGMPIVPPEIEAKLENCSRFHQQHGQCVFCSILLDEQRDRQRIVAETPSFVALCPYASRFAYETWILPREHCERYQTCTDQQLWQLAGLIRDSVLRIEKTLPLPAYNILLHTAPFDRCAQAHYHWHIEIFPRFTQLAGFELATGCYVNSVSPEQAAIRLRQVDASS